MLTILTVALIILAILAAVVFVWILRRTRETGEEEEEDDLTEWDCPRCGFHVQMGMECIYCGERRPEGQR
ncbi:MAG: hypothetical protein ACE5LH_07455 [Fidelibacterota bacterium]